MSGDDLEREDEESRAKMARVRQNPRLAEARAAAAQGADVSGYDVYDPNAPEPPDPNGPSPDAAPDAAKAYVPPTAVPPKRRRDTLELQAKVQLAPDIDPRKAVTLPSIAKQLLEEHVAAEKKAARIDAAGGEVPATKAQGAAATPFGPPVRLDAEAAKRPFAPRVMPLPSELEGAVAAQGAPVSAMMTPSAPEPISPTPAGGVSLTSEVFIGRATSSGDEPTAGAALGAEPPPAQPEKRSRWSTEPLEPSMGGSPYASMGSGDGGGIDPAALPSSHRPMSSDAEEDLSTAIPMSRKRSPLVGIAVALVAVGIVAAVALRGMRGPEGPTANETAQAGAPATSRSAAEPAPPPAPTSEPTGATAAASPATTTAPMEATPEPKAATPAPEPAPPPAKPAERPRTPGPPPPTSKVPTPKPADTFRDIF